MRSTYRNRTSSSTRGPRWMDLRYAGTCRGCNKQLPKGSRAFYDPRDRLICCTSLECADRYNLVTEVWHGSPTSGRYVKTLSERRIGTVESDPFARTRSRGYYGRDAGRCEDAPCCGCCD